jgi:hypothetical protein
MRFCPLLYVAALLCSAPWLQAAETGFTPIFNGKDLTGWEGDPRLWSVHQGILRGQTALPDKMTKGNTFLIWRGGTLKDFELKLKFRIENGNSGVQYRSKEIGKWVMSGYQAEVENKQGKVGFLYEEKGRKYLANVGEMVEIGEDGKPKVTGGLGDKQKDFIDRGYFKPKEWNEYFIIARGNHIEHWLNGFKTIEVNDNDPKGRSIEGLLGLQIHAGPPMLVEFQDILLKNL